MFTQISATRTHCFSSELNCFTPQVMYVGVTYTGNGPYRSEVPAVSSRSLDSNSLFQVERSKELPSRKISIVLLNGFI